MSIDPFSLSTFLNQLRENSTKIEFSDVIALIEHNYSYSPTTFKNGSGDDLLENKAGTNEGSCKIFAFAKLHGLTEEQTLQCFGHYYREDVLQHLEGKDHGNIRNFIKYGWPGIRFEGEVLTKK